MTMIFMISYHLISINPAFDYGTCINPMNCWICPLNQLQVSIEVSALHPPRQPGTRCRISVDWNYRCHSCMKYFATFNDDWFWWLDYIYICICIYIYIYCYCYYYYYYTRPVLVNHTGSWQFVLIVFGCFCVSPHLYQWFAYPPLIYSGGLALRM